MNYRLEFDFGDKGLGIKRFLDINCPNINDIINAINNGEENLYNQIYDEFEDIISEATSSYDIVPAGSFSKEEAHELVYSAAYNYIDEMIIKAQVLLVGNEKEIGFSTQVNKDILQALKARLYEIIDDRQTYEQCDIDETAAMIACVNAFIEKGNWHFGLLKSNNTVITDAQHWPTPLIEKQKISWIKDSEILKPVLWFGPEGDSPIDYWSIYGTEKDLEENIRAAFTPKSDISLKSCTTEKERHRNCSIWFPLSNIEIEDILGDTDADWYTYYWIAECGMDEPKINDSILEQCPIVLTYEDTVDSMLDKINQFFIAHYKKIHTDAC